LQVLQAAEQSLVQNGVAVALTPLQQPAQPVSWDQRGVTVHPSAVVGDEAQIGPGSKVWHFCHVMDGAKIGRNCSLGHGVFVQSGAILGDRVRVQNHVSLYDGVVLEDDVFCGPSCVFTNVVRPRAHVSRRHAFAQTLVGRGATIGANATVVCGNSLGRYSFVAAGSVVSRDVPAHALVRGNPARITGWVCSCGEKLPWPARPDIGASARCTACDALFVMTADGVAATSVAP
jgi:UDP-2-acetamido-3-amino-2,3-dideoxy-glucuronate N-acetyltransferase